MKIAVVCSDDRMIQVYDNLAKDHCVLRVDTALKLSDYKEDIDVLVLPVKGIKSDTAFWEGWKPTLLIFCGLRYEELDALPYTVAYYMEDKEVIHNNAIISAEGVLNELIGCCARSIYDITVDVIGYGNCGSVIYEMLHNLQVSTRVIRRNCEEQGDFITIAHWKDCGDVIINTSIQYVMDEKRIRSWSKKPVIIDIATPDVIDRSCCEQLGIKIIKAGNLPGRFASISAGNIIADYIRGKLEYEG